jgi:hypothetical protein
MISSPSVIVLSSVALFASLSAQPSTAFATTKLKDVLRTSGEWLLERQEKCLPTEWKGGDPKKFYVTIVNEVCLVGDFGNDMPIDEMRTMLGAQSVGNAKVNGIDLGLYEARVEASAPVVGTPTIDAEVLVLGMQVWTKSASAPKISFDKEFTLLNFDKSFQSKIKIGPIPASVSAGVTGRIDTSVLGELAFANASAEINPVLKSGAYAQVEVDLALASAGVEGVATLANNDTILKGSAGLLIGANDKLPMVSYVTEGFGNFDIEALSGEINLFARWKDGKDIFVNSLWKHQGIELSKELFRFRTNPTPVFQSHPFFPFAQL